MILPKAVQSALDAIEITYNAPLSDKERRTMLEATLLHLFTSAQRSERENHRKTDAKINLSGA